MKLFSIAVIAASYVLMLLTWGLFLDGDKFGGIVLIVVAWVLHGLGVAGLGFDDSNDSSAPAKSRSLTNPRSDWLPPIEVTMEPPPRVSLAKQTPIALPPPEPTRDFLDDD